VYSVVRIKKARRGIAPHRAFTGALAEHHRKNHMDDYSTNGFPTPVFALVSDCPWCGGVLTIRHTRADRKPFIGCTDYPGCTYTSSYEIALQTLGRESADTSPALAKALTKLAAACHPDRWQGHPVAEEITKQVLELRQQVREGRL